MKFKRPETQKPELNIAPMIDVLFSLLLFFMVATSFTKETRLSVQLPEANGEPPVTDVKPMEIVISAAGDFSVNGRPLLNRSIETLMKVMSQESGGKSDIPLILSADRNTPHQAVVTAMDAAGKLGFTQLSITTQLPANQ